MAKRQSAFTLIEILIVVIILGILAAIVIPQFSSASEDAKKGAAMTTQASLRAQIQLYKLQHNDTYPTILQLNATAAPWGIMTKKTSTAGAIVADDAAGAVGPYLQAIPVNQINSKSLVDAAGVAMGVNVTEATLLADVTNGWLYDEATGRIWATLHK